MATIKVNFEDQGQDLLYFVIDSTSLVVTEAGPFHNDIYKDSQVKSQVIEGRYITINNQYGIQQIKYPIIKIDVINDKN
ncbi:hypothetical protein J0383_07930 [Flavobacterium endoglycinae]|uniref:Uncharacterized protein n=1 Tax=Flavobacterium endoglycinae TaxID=2816357 RepID=A0ABX7QJT9_9FLAO|nr:hypothetical protein [Flavobacterium endoglycinae]QSW90728.1 hypothetical protein J0383_07930 [Flavobacterium endoglycinae]